MLALAFLTVGCDGGVPNESSEADQVDELASAPKPESPPPGTEERAAWVEGASRAQRVEDRVAWLRYLEKECARSSAAVDTLLALVIKPAMTSGACVEVGECPGWELFEQAADDVLALDETFGRLATTGSRTTGDPIDFRDAHQASACWKPTDRWSQELDSYRKEALMSRAKRVWRRCDELNEKLYERKVAVAEGVADGTCPSGGTCKAMTDLRDYMFKMQKEVPKVMADARQLLGDASSHGEEGTRIEIARGIEKFCDGTGRYPRRAPLPAPSLE